MLKRSALLWFCFLPIFTLVAQENEITISAVEVKPQTPFRYAALLMKGDYAQHGDAFQRLYQLAALQNLGYNIEVFGIYYDDPSSTPVDQLNWLLGFPLAEGQHAAEPLVERTYDYPLVATITYTGPLTEQMAQAYEKLFGYVMSNGLQIAGPIMQRYVTMPTQNAKGEWCGTVVSVLPVKK
ncbi:MAG: GyrI-like domain-containing protein [candidate division KSB1 bacterium]|nr:GyrI-like domain-containing protein [candidate division KSB1 bacterium]